MKKLAFLFILVLLMGCEKNTTSIPIIQDSEPEKITIEEPYPLENLRVVDTEPVFKYDNITLETLEVSRLVLSPAEVYNKGFRLTFNLEANETSHLILLDSEDHIINELDIMPTNFDIEVDNQTVAVNVFKGVFLNLKANKTYHYIIQQGISYSERYTFKTPSFTSTTLAYFGDIQGYKLKHYEAFLATYKHALDYNPDISYLAGDIVDNSMASDQWGYIDNTLKEYLNSSIWMTTVGNHDVYDAETYYINAFNYPKNGLEYLEERHYYIDLPNARIAVLDTESSSSFEAQSQWLIETMADVEGFKIVFMHRAAYPMAYNEPHIRALHETFDTADIDLVLGGHDHIYSRTTMQGDLKVAVNEGVTYIVGGSPSGSKYYEEDLTVNRYWRDIVYDENNPVFSILTFGETINISVYALVEDEKILIDQFNIK